MSGVWCLVSGVWCLVRAVQWEGCWVGGCIRATQDTRVAAGDRTLAAGDRTLAAGDRTLAAAVIAHPPPPATKV